MTTNGTRTNCSACNTQKLVDCIVDAVVVRFVTTNRDKVYPKIEPICGDCAIACVGCSTTLPSTARSYGSLCYACYTEPRPKTRCCITCGKGTGARYIRCYNCGMARR